MYASELLAMEAEEEAEREAERQRRKGGRR
jgi:hypothetical protein